MDNILFKNGNHNVGILDLDITIIGPVSDVKAFFECIDIYIYPSKLSYPIELITDKLYKRSVKFEELDDTLALMLEVEEQLKQIKTKDVDWEETSYVPENNDLDLSGDNLGKIFYGFFRAFEGAVDNTKFCKNSPKKNLYKDSNFSVRLVCSDTPFHWVDGEITDAQFDALPEDAEPIWARKRYVNRDMDDHIKRLEKRSENFARKLKEKREKEALKSKK